MKAILLQFWGVCLLRRGPEQIPTRGSFLVLVVVLNLATTMAVSRAFTGEVPLLEIATLLVVNLAVQAALIWFALEYANVANRFVTVMTAMLGCDLILTILVGVLLGVCMLLFGKPPLIVQLLFQIWSFAIIGFILHRALNVSLTIGVLIGLGVSLMGLMVGQAAVS